MSYISYNQTMEEIKILVYTTDSGKQPYADWQLKLDSIAKYTVIARLARIKQGNFGDCKKIKNADIWELRIHLGSGYRIYLGKQGTTCVILLVGGDKGSQTRDIAKAQEYWLTYKRKNRG